MDDIRQLMELVKLKMAMRTQLQKAYQNLHPDYKKELKRNQFHTFKELEMLGKIFEKEERSRKRYKPPPAPKDPEFPRMAFHPESYFNKNESCSYASRPPRDNN